MANGYITSYAVLTGSRSVFGGEESPDYIEHGVLLKRRIPRNKAAGRKAQQKAYRPPVTAGKGETVG